jgi:hypothetical protein
MSWRYGLVLIWLLAMAGLLTQRVGGDDVTRAAPMAGHTWHLVGWQVRTVSPGDPAKPNAAFKHFLDQRDDTIALQLTGPDGSSATVELFYDAFWRDEHHLMRYDSLAPRMHPEQADQSHQLLRIDADHWVHHFFGQANDSATFSVSWYQSADRLFTEAGRARLSQYLGRLTGGRSDLCVVRISALAGPIRHDPEALFDLSRHVRQMVDRWLGTKPPASDQIATGVQPAGYAGLARGAGRH